MREIRLFGSEGGEESNPLSLPLSRCNARDDIGGRRSVGAGSREGGHDRACPSGMKRERWLFGGRRSVGAGDREAQFKGALAPGCRI